jgi:hypothetical protein
VAKASLLVHICRLYISGFASVKESLQDVLLHTRLYPDSKYTLELKQDEALLFMFYSSKTVRQKIVNK